VWDPGARTIVQAESWRRNGAYARCAVAVDHGEMRQRQRSINNPTSIYAPGGASISNLQRAIGNRAVGHLVSGIARTSGNGLWSRFAPSALPPDAGAAAHRSSAHEIQSWSRKTRCTEGVLFAMTIEPVRAITGPLTGWIDRESEMLDHAAKSVQSPLAAWVTSSWV
jgi:hypothetical protein